MDKFDQETYATFLIEQAQQLIHSRHLEIDQRIDCNQWKVIRAFQKHKVSDYHFAPSSGYAYNDRGREVLDLVYADVFGAEAAIVRPHFVSGTHTIAVALFGVLRPGDELLFITGKPYDTLHKVIGATGDGTGSLRDWGVACREIDLNEDGLPDWQHISRVITAKTKVIAIQRSRGYSWKYSFSIEQIREMVQFVKEIRSDLIVFVDNCYGEFVEKEEPTEVGVDLIAGSLIKNPGGGITASGGYIAGKRQFVELCANRLTVPGIGAEVGAMLGTIKDIFQGFFLAPHFVGQALKGSVLAAAVFEKLGFETRPAWNEHRTDIIQAIRFTEERHLITFVQAIQKSAAIDSHVVPIPWAMPGYEHAVIMAAGTFMQGGSLELSADAPIREPYIAYLQGGLTYSHVKLGIFNVILHMLNNSNIKYKE